MAMPVDALVASLQPLTFDGPAPYTAEAFAALAGDVALPAAWRDLEAQIRNVIAEERVRRRQASPSAGEETDAARCRHAVSGCSLYWMNRARAAMAEKDPLRRDAALDRVFWDAAGELTPVTNPLSRGALQTYAIRLAIARKRSALSREKGNAVFDRLIGS